MKTLVHRILLTLCVFLAGALVAVWNRSYSRYDRFHWVEWQRQGDLVSLRLSGIDVSMGCVQYVNDQTIWSNDADEIRLMQIAAGRFQPDGRPYRGTRQTRSLIRGNADSLMGAMGFEYRNIGPEDLSAGRIEIAVPFWAIFAAVLTYPVTQYIRGVLRRHKNDRQSLNLCPRCGEPVPAAATHCAHCDRPVVVVSEA